MLKVIDNKVFNNNEIIFSVEDVYSTEIICVTSTNFIVHHGVYHSGVCEHIEHVGFGVYNSKGKRIKMYDEFVETANCFVLIKHNKKTNVVDIYDKVNGKIIQSY